MVEPAAVVLDEHDIGIHEFGLRQKQAVGRGKLLVGGGKRLDRLLERLIFLLECFVFLRRTLQLRLLRGHVVLRLADGALGAGKASLQLFNRLRLLRQLVLRIEKLLLRVAERLLQNGQVLLALFQI